MRKGEKQVSINGSFVDDIQRANVVDLRLQ